MDEKMNELLEKVCANWTDEQKEKAKSCKTLDELTAFAGEEGIELPDEAVNAVSGGKSVSGKYMRPV